MGSTCIHKPEGEIAQQLRECHQLYGNRIYVMRDVAEAFPHDPWQAGGTCARL